MIRRGLFLLAIFAAVSLFPPVACPAQGESPPPWPVADITFTVPFNSGSETAALFSLVQDAFAAKTGKAMTARLVPGRAGANAWARLVDDAPDGSVLTAVLLPDAYLRMLQPDSGVNVDAMGICHVIAYMPAVLWTVTSSSFASVDDVTAAAAKSDFSAAGPGSYSAGQIAARSLDRQTGTRSLYVPYSGTVTAAKAAADKQVQVFWGYSVRVAPPGLDPASLQPLAVAAPARLPALPETPTFKELGMTIDEGVHIGVAVPADTPEITRQEISEFFAVLAGDSSFRAKAEALGFVPHNVGLSDMASFLAEMKESADAKAQDFSLRE